MPNFTVAASEMLGHGPAIRDRLLPFFGPVPDMPGAEIVAYRKTVKIEDRVPRALTALEAIILTADGKQVARHISDNSTEMSHYYRGVSGALMGDGTSYQAVCAHIRAPANSGQFPNSGLFSTWHSYFLPSGLLLSIANPGYALIVLNDHVQRPMPISSALPFIFAPLIHEQASNHLRLSFAFEAGQMIKRLLNDEDRIEERGIEVGVGLPTKRLEV
jgi:hypothetical protein